MAAECWSYAVSTFPVWIIYIILITLPDSQWADEVSAMQIRNGYGMYSSADKHIGYCYTEPEHQLERSATLP